ncbi:MAG: putative phytochrome sensor protein [Chthoniobacteraceae bacterium]|nr:putative phytochrome sensor protein [Chthoniobacteraceae bacterium]
MKPPKKKVAATDALVGLWTISLTAFVVATLYFTRELLIPLALSALLTFLLAPLVSRIERWVGRIAAVLLVVTLIFIGTGAAGWMLTRQLIDLAIKLPEYKGNIVTKMHAFETPKGGAFSQISNTVEELKKELPGGSAAVEAPVVSQEAGKPQTAVTSPPAAPAPAVPVQVIETSRANPFELLQTIVAPLLGPLGTGALVLILVICMLFQREDLRNRLIRLIGQGRISTTTRAMDDAAARVSRYLLMQFIVNLTYGVFVAIGLYFIGVPNPMLWGAFGMVLRFIPYVGPWIACVIPTVLALAVSPHWNMPILTLALFGGLELILNNVMEPLLYGSSTGVSSIALIIAAVFWTWLWGPIGLVLATPLTVCLVVIGHHVPRLSFLSVVLSDEDALTPAEDCYHRMLTIGEKDEMELVDSYLKSNSLTSLYDALFIPVITAAEMDERLEVLEEDQLVLVRQSMRDIIDDLGTRPGKVVQPSANAEKSEALAPVIPCSVYCLPARAERDELVGEMLAQLLKQEGFTAFNASGKLVVGELIALTENEDVDLVCISVVAPSTVTHARYLCSKLRAQQPDLKIIVGLWGEAGDISASAKILRDAGADEIVISLADAVAQITKLAPFLVEQHAPAGLPADEEERLVALANLELLNKAPDPLLDRLTAKLTRIFEVPIALISLIDRDRQCFVSQAGLPDDLVKKGEIPRDVSICGHVVLANEPLIVSDLARDRRFASNPMIKERGFRFYAGVPLRTVNGQPIGSFCILDTKPRHLDEREKRLLQEYGKEVMEEITHRASVGELVKAG